jgi:hypothetical protein
VAADSGVYPATAAPAASVADVFRKSRRGIGTPAAAAVASFPEEGTPGEAGSGRDAEAFMKEERSSGLGASRTD